MPIPPGRGVRSIAIAGSSLYLVMQTGDETNAFALYRSYFGTGSLSAPSLRWSGEATGVSVTAMGTAGPPSTAVYFGTFGGGASQILSVDALQDEGSTPPPPPTVVVDVPQAVPDRSVGPILGITSDGTSVFWTQVLGSTPIVRHDVGAPESSATIVFDPLDGLNLVAVDNAYVYSIGTSSELYAANKARDDAEPLGAAVPLAGPAIAGLPIVARAGEVYYVSSLAGSETLYHAARPGAGSGGSAFLPGYTVGPFAMVGCWLVFGSGTNVMLGGIGLGSAYQVWGTDGGSGIAGVAAGSEYFAFFNQDSIGVFPLPDTCPNSSE